MEEKYRITLLTIGAQHPAWSKNPDDALVRIFNQVTAAAREAVGAVGDDDDTKADWCENELERLANRQADEKVSVTFLNIQWETDDKTVDLPTELTMDVDASVDLSEEGADVLSDKYGFLVNSFKYEINAKRLTATLTVKASVYDEMECIVNQATGDCDDGQEFSDGVTFADGLQMDIHVVGCGRGSDESCWTEGVLFDNGCEVGCTPVGDEFGGEYVVEHNGCVYTTLVVRGE